MNAKTKATKPAPLTVSYQVIAYDLQGKTHLLGSQLSKDEALAKIHCAIANPIYKATAIKWEGNQ